ncbi:MAG: hypothetical protein M0006_01460 [Magnetospirillum sp.]|nr:hypothetical protein [Magnetospirillum sp.]
MRVDAGTAARRWEYADGSLALCPRCNTPMFAKPVEAPPFAGAPEGEWFLLYCPGDGCAWEEYVRRGSMERWTRDGRLLSATRTAPRGR